MYNKFICSAVYVGVPMLNFLSKLLVSIFKNCFTYLHLVHYFRGTSEFQKNLKNALILKTNMSVLTPEPVSHSATCQSVQILVDPDPQPFGFE
jgi:hypothetical protein